MMNESWKLEDWKLGQNLTPKPLEIWEQARLGNEIALLIKTTSRQKPTHIQMTPIPFIVETWESWRRQNFQTASGKTWQYTLKMICASKIILKRITSTPIHPLLPYSFCALEEVLLKPKTGMSILITIFSMMPQMLTQLTKQHNDSW